MTGSAARKARLVRFMVVSLLCRGRGIRPRIDPRIAQPSAHQCADHTAVGASITEYNHAIARHNDALPVGGAAPIPTTPGVGSSQERGRAA